METIEGLAKATVPQLRTFLEQRGQSTEGLKKDLFERAVSVWKTESSATTTEKTPAEVGAGDVKVAVTTATTQAPVSQPQFIRRRRRLLVTVLLAPKVVRRPNMADSLRTKIIADLTTKWTRTSFGLISVCVSSKNATSFRKCRKTWKNKLGVCDVMRMTVDVTRKSDSDLNVLCTSEDAANWRNNDCCT